MSEMQRGGNRVGVDDGMRSIVVRKRASNEDWLAPKPIPNDLARVEAFALELLPDRLAPWIDDIATRLQCPPDYPAITAMTASCSRGRPAMDRAIAHRQPARFPNPARFRVLPHPWRQPLGPERPAQVWFSLSSAPLC